MSVQYVNGTPCYNCTDVERAKKAALETATKAQDPLHPSTVIPSDNGPGGSRSNAGPVNAQPVGINQPLAGGNRGTTLNLLL